MWLAQSFGILLLFLQDLQFFSSHAPNTVDLHNTTSVLVSVSQSIQQLSNDAFTNIFSKTPMDFRRRRVWSAMNRAENGFWKLSLQFWPWILSTIHDQSQLAALQMYQPGSLQHTSLPCFLVLCCYFFSFHS